MKEFSEELFFYIYILKFSIFFSRSRGQTKILKCIAFKCNLISKISSNMLGLSMSY